jgi:hypothetical protein
MSGSKWSKGMVKKDLYIFKRNFHLFLLLLVSVGMVVLETGLLLEVGHGWIKVCQPCINSNSYRN